MQREQLLHASAIIKLIPFLRILRLKMFRVFADATPCNSQAVSDTPTPPEQKKTKKKQCGRKVFESSCQSFSGCHLHFKQTVKASWSWLLSNSWFAAMWQGGHVVGELNTIFSRRINVKIEMLFFLATDLAAVTSRENQQYYSSWWLFVTDNLRHSIVNALTALTWNILSSLRSKKK